MILLNHNFFGNERWHKYKLAATFVVFIRVGDQRVMTIKPVSGSTTSLDYWAAYLGGAKIKTDGLKQQTQTDVIIH